jgi:hypothetical protein
MLNRLKSRGLSAWGVALVSCAAGSFATAGLMHLNQVRADSDRVFELNIYHAVPGKVPALEARFRDAAPLIAQHGLDVLGYWVPTEGPAGENTFVYLLAHTSREEAKERWHAFHADPAFQKYVKSEEAEKLIENVDKIYMRPTDFSSMR